MNTIYVVTPTQYHWEGMLGGFATDDDDVRLILQNHFRKYRFQESVGVIVDMADGTATVIALGKREETYYIQAIREVKEWTPSTL